MTKQTTSAKTSGVKIRHYTPIVVYFATFGIGFLSYVIGRIALGAYPHPIHWASGIVGAIIGYFFGWLWYRWRGDIL